MQTGHIERGMKVFLVEDSAPLCERLVEMIEADGAHAVVGQAASYDDAVEGIEATRPDVGIFDIRLQRGNGIDALAEAKRRMPQLVGIVMSNYATPQHVKASADAVDPARRPRARERRGLLLLSTFRRARPIGAEISRAALA
jgi:chemotaxis response regulator CheB